MSLEEPICEQVWRTGLDWQTRPQLSSLRESALLDVSHLGISGIAPRYLRSARAHTYVLARTVHSIEEDEVELPEESLGRRVARSCQLVLWSALTLT